MTSEGLGEMFEGHSADTCDCKFSLMSMGGQAEGLACADRKRGPPSARAEFVLFQHNHYLGEASNKPTKYKLLSVLLMPEV